MRGAVIRYVVGPSGSGKSYLRCARYLVDDLLPSGGRLHSNYPVKMDGLAELTGLDQHELADRVRMIPRHELQRWASGQTGPWDYFRDVDLSGWTIAIDEVHNYCSTGSPAAHRRKWAAWLGEVRHRGVAGVELLTQADAKVANEVRREAAVRWEIVSSESRRDPYCRIPIADWHALARTYGLRTVSRVGLIECRQVGNRWVPQHATWVSRDPRYYAAYDSFSAPESGCGAGAQHEPTLTVRRFLAMHAWALATRLLVAGLLLYVLFGGGGTLIGCAMGAMTSAINPASPAAATSEPVPLSIQPMTPDGPAEATPGEPVARTVRVLGGSPGRGLFTDEGFVPCGVVRVGTWRRLRLDCDERGARMGSSYLYLWRRAPPPLPASNSP